MESDRSGRLLTADLAAPSNLITAEDYDIQAALRDLSSEEVNVWLTEVYENEVEKINCWCFCIVFYNIDTDVTVQIVLQYCTVWKLGQSVLNVSESE